MPPTLLLADDSVTIRRVIELTFAGEDMRVAAVSTGREAIARIDAERPDIVLADIGMADVSGYDLSAFIKGRPDLKHIPVVLLAGAFEPIDEARARKVGSDGVLVKPFEPQMVVARVRELLDRPSAPARAAHQPAAPMMSGRTAEPAEAATLRAASGSSETEPLFDASLDRLDAAFANNELTGPAIDDSIAGAFAKDLRELRASGRGDADDRHEFGDWDLPSRTAPEILVQDDFEPLRREPAAPVLPPPVTLERHAPAPRPPAAVAAAPQPAPAPRSAPAPVRVPVAPAAAAPLADTFSSLLAAEEGRPYQRPVTSAAPVATAVAAAAPPAAAADLSDAAIEKIVDRVIARLGSGVRGTVIDLAERLVRAEIDRLKALR